MSREEYLLLYEKYLKGACTDAEKDALFSHQDDFYWPEDSEMQVFLKDKNIQKTTYQQIRQTLHLRQKRRGGLKWIAAATVLFISGTCLWWYTAGERRNQTKMLTNRVLNVSDTINQRHVPTLKLANGKTILLNVKDQGILAASSEVAIRKVANGKIQYSAASSSSNKSPGNNTLTIPKGEQYQLILPDGTKVWLNAASSLTFPEFFADKSRTVILEGEAYFEVANQAHMPFYVKAKGTTIEVLGTHFNISAYPDDLDVKASLMEGAVKLSNEKASSILKPGQQGTFSSKSAIRVEKVNLDDVRAWMNGYFIFNNESIVNIMKQVKRWYDVDVAYEGDVQQVKYGGMISRYDDVRQFLHVLEMTSTIHCKIEGRHIVLHK